MIDTGLAVGCLHEVIKDALKQGDHAVKYQKWLAWGRGQSFKEFWGEEYAG